MESATLDPVTISRLYSEQCAAEPIHEPGSIQSHGLMIVVAPASRRVVQVSAGVLRQLALSAPEQAIGHCLEQVLSTERDVIDAALAPLETGPPRPVDLPLAVFRGYECVGHLSGGWAVLEWTPVGEGELYSSREDKAFTSLSRSLQRLRDLDDSDFLQAVTREIQAISGYDRVMLYRFLPDWSGEVLEEQCAPGVEQKFLGLRFPSGDIPPQARRLYTLSTLRVLADVDASADPLLPPRLPDGSKLDQSHCVLRSLSPAHHAYLHNMGVKATMTVSLFKGQKLWGMLACHHGQPRVVPNEVREAVRSVCELVSSVVSMRIAGVEERQKQKEALRRSELLYEIDAALTRSGAVHDTAGFASELCEVFAAQSFGYAIGEVRFVSEPVRSILGEEHALELVRGLMASGEHGRTTALSLETMPGWCESDAFAGVLACRIGSGPGDFCFFTRPEQPREVQWGGDPRSFGLREENGEVLLQPRHSFEAWQETVRGRCREWLDVDREAITRLAGVMRECFDANVRKTMARELRWRAERDSLTGLYNRSMLDQEVGARLQLPGCRLAVVLVDLDHFKRVNDTLGHEAGDQLLVTAARQLKDAVQRDRDAVIRMGGDEFVLLCPVHEPCERNVSMICQRLLRSLYAGEVPEATELPLGLSIGVACEGKHGTSSGDLLRHADLALYEAKARGRNTFVIYDELLGERMAEDIELERELRRDLGTSRIALHYQPRLSLASRRVVGFEALLRWNHETRGPISPARFIPLAESSGLIAELGSWVVAEAVACLARRRGQGLRDVSIAVNVSMAEVFDKGLVDRIAQCCAASDVPPALLEIELTETAAIDDLPQTEHFLKSLRDLGVRCAIDDFGTGYSSLAYLRQLPIDYVKIDRAFVVDNDSPQASRTLLRGILGLTGGLGLVSIAEGVETPEQLAWLEAHGCDEAQGFLFERAVPEAAMEQTLRSLEERWPLDGQALQ